MFVFISVSIIKHSNPFSFSYSDKFLLHAQVYNFNLQILFLIKETFYNSIMGMSEIAGQIETR